MNVSKRIEVKHKTSGVAVFGTIGILLVSAVSRGQDPSPAMPQLTDKMTAPARSLGEAYASVAAHVRPAVVSVTSEKMVSVNSDGMPFLFNDPFFRRFFGGGGPQQMPQSGTRKIPEHALGSGMILDKKGRILTNFHVVQDVDKIRVTLADKRVFPAKVVGTDPKTDVAIIIIDGQVPDDLPAIALGNSDTLKVGELVMAVGAPFGFVQTVTTGIISATGRENVGLADYEDFLQTDAPINPGNSGGPLVNMNGQVIGMNTAIATGVGQFSGVGFAIPINMIKTIMPVLLKGGTVTRGFLGVAIQNLNEDLAEEFQAPSTQGALITQVNSDSPAEKAGLRVGDVITKYNGKKVESSSELRNMVASTEPNRRVELMIYRGGKEQTVTITVGKLQPEQQAATATGGELLSKFGLTVQPLTPELAQQHGYKKAQGLLVTDVAGGSPAAMGGVQPGDLIAEVNRQKTADVDELRQALANSPDKNKVLLLVQRGDTSLFIVLQVQ